MFITIDREDPTLGESQYKEIVKWFASSDTGSSSKCLIYFLTIKEVGRKEHPYDNDDLGRCIRALEKLPFLEKDLIKAKEISKEWESIVDNWSLLVSLFKREKHQEVYAILSKARKKG